MSVMENKLINAKFIDILVAISSEEERVEQMRINICQNPSFTIYSGFAMLDQNNKGTIQEQELSNLVDADQNLLQRVIKHYSDSGNGITFTNIFPLILPHNNQKLRKEITSRQNYVQVSSDESSIIRDQLTMLLDKEISLFQMVDKYSGKYNIGTLETIQQIFKQIDKDKDGKISQDDLVEYCFNQKYKLYKEQFQFIWNRLNTHNLQTINLERFMQFFQTDYQENNQQIGIQFLDASNKQYPIKSDWQTNTSCAYHPITKQQRLLIPDLQELLHQRQVLKYFFVIYINSGNSKSNKSVFQQKPFKTKVHSINRQSRCYKNYAIGQTLIQQIASGYSTDFNRGTYFFQGSVIGPVEIYDTLEKLLGFDFGLQNNDITLFINFFEGKDQKIIFSQFAEAMTPKSPQYAKVIQDQHTIVNGSDFEFIINTFSKDTQEIVKIFFAKLLLLLKYMNKAKISLKDHLIFRLVDLLAFLDKDQDMILNQKDIVDGAKQLKMNQKPIQTSYFFLGHDNVTFEYLQTFFQPI